MRGRSVCGRSTATFLASGGRRGSISIPGYTFLHVSKLPNVVKEELQRRSLILEQADPLFPEMCGREGFRIVEETASGVVLAMIADFYGRQHNLRSITDEGLCYLTSVLNQEPMRRRDVAATHLATAIIRVEVPECIGTLTPKQYVVLRNRYEGIREPFQRAMRTICDDTMLASITTRKAFQDTARDATRDFWVEVERIRKRKWADRLGKWGPMSLGVASTLCQLASPVTAAVGAGIDVCLKVREALRPGVAPVTDVKAAQQMMATLRSELIAPSLARRLLSYAKA